MMIPPLDLIFLKRTTYVHGSNKNLSENSDAPGSINTIEKDVFFFQGFARFIQFIPLKLDECIAQNDVLEETSAFEYGHVWYLC